jgi:predicted short-subunit dehydrogenase-like oxidoreductase (DUF2520 family)
VSARPPRTLLIGHGQLGGALAAALGARAPGAAVVWTRRDVPPRHRAAGVRYAHGDAVVAGELSADCEAAFLAVPDRQVAAAAAALAAARPVGSRREAARRVPDADRREGGRAWRGVAVFHAAGALGLEPLRPLAARGAATAVLHPLRAVPGTDAAAPAAAALFEGAPFTLAGDARAVAVGARLVAALGGTLLQSGVADRAAYHLAAVLASNYGRLLLEWSARRFEASGLAAADARTAAAALLANAASAGVPRRPTRGAAVAGMPAVPGPGAAAASAAPPSFTGPIRRGDAATVEAHLAALSGAELAAYAALGLLLVEEVGAREPAASRGRPVGRDAVAAALRAGLDRALRGSPPSGKARERAPADPDGSRPTSGRAGPARRAGKPA